MADTDVTSTGRKARPVQLEGHDLDLIVDIQGRFEHPFNQVEVVRAALHLLDQRTRELTPRTKADVIAALASA